jgi:hypothetical protein
MACENCESVVYTGSTIGRLDKDTGHLKDGLCPGFLCWMNCGGWESKVFQQLSAPNPRCT